MPEYNYVRALIKSGDILLCSGNGLFPKMIKKFTRSKWSHVGFIIRVDSIDRIMVLESVENIGVRCVPLSSYFNDYNGSGKPYNGEVNIARHNEMHEINITNLSQHAVDLLGHRYDTLEILRIFYRLALPFFFKGHESLNKTDDVYICSEYVYSCFKSIGISIKHEGGFVIPSDFANDKNIKFVCRAV